MVPDYSLPTCLEGLVAQMRRKGMDAGSRFEAAQREAQQVYVPCIPFFWSGFSAEQQILLEELALILEFNERMCVFREKFASHLHAEGRASLARDASPETCRDRASRRIRHYGVVEFEWKGAEHGFAPYAPPSDDDGADVKAVYAAHCAGSDVMRYMHSDHLVVLNIAILNLELLRMRRISPSEVIGASDDEIVTLCGSEAVATASPREPRRASADDPSQLALVAAAKAGSSSAAASMPAAAARDSRSPASALVAGAALAAAGSRRRACSAADLGAAAKARELEAAVE